MSHTNSTTNYGLPQFLTTDKPFWLTDINGAFSAIDTAIKNAKDAGDNAQGDATQALSDASDANTAASGASSKADGALASIADTYSAASTYTTGDLVIYNSLLYVCTTDIITPEAWDGSHWSRITAEDLIATKANASDIPTGANMGGIGAVSGRTSNLNGGSVKIGNVRLINHNFRVDTAAITNDKLFQLANASDYPASSSYLVAFDANGAPYRIAALNNGGFFAVANMPAQEYVLQGYYVTT